MIYKINKEALIQEDSYNSTIFDLISDPYDRIQHDLGYEGQRMETITRLASNEPHDKDIYNTQALRIQTDINDRQHEMNDELNDNIESATHRANIGLGLGATGLGLGAAGLGAGIYNMRRGIRR